MEDRSHLRLPETIAKLAAVLLLPSSKLDYFFFVVDIFLVIFNDNVNMFMLPLRFGIFIFL